VHDSGPSSRKRSDYYTDVPPELADARLLAFRHTGQHFAEEEAGVHTGGPSLVLAMYGLPWSTEYEHPLPSPEDRHDLDSMESVRDGMWANGSLDKGHWSPAGGASWLGLATPHDRDELRLYEDRPAVLGLHRHRREPCFSPLRFMQTFANTYAFARRLLPAWYPDRRVGLAYWRFHNDGAALGLVPDFGDVESHPALVQTVSDGPAEFPFVELSDAVDLVVARAQEHFLQRLYDAYAVPWEKRQSRRGLLRDA
jgi:hypothetical protein